MITARTIRHTRFYFPYSSRRHVTISVNTRRRCRAFYRTVDGRCGGTPIDSPAFDLVCCVFFSRARSDFCARDGKRLYHTENNIIRLFRRATRVNLIWKSSYLRVRPKWWLCSATTYPNIYRIGIVDGAAIMVFFFFRQQRRFCWFFSLRTYALCELVLFFFSVWIWRRRTYYFVRRMSSPVWLYRSPACTNLRSLSSNDVRFLM